MYLTENLQEKWQPVLEHPDLPKIGDSYKRAVTTVILENQEKAVREDRGFMTEAAPGNSVAGGGVDNWDPVLISLVRRAMPNLIAYDVCGVQPMTGPTGLIFAMKSKFLSQDGPEALFDEANTEFSSDNATTDNAGASGDAQSGTNPATLNDSSAVYTTSSGMTTAAAEALGDASTNAFAEMAFSIDKVTVTARSRALKAEYSMELAQDLKAVHGLSAESELANILSTEILAEMNREMINTINVAATPGTIGTLAATVRTIDATATSGDLDGRWNVERFKALHHIIEREANGIAIATRRGKGNFLICSADVASSLAAAGTLDYTPALQANLNVDAAGNTFAGVIGGKMKVYVDPYAAADYITVGYKGSNAYDAGIFYCPYVPLTMMRASDAATFQPKIGFKSRYGMVANPFTSLTANLNTYYRTSLVSNL